MNPQKPGGSWSSDVVCWYHRRQNALVQNLVLILYQKLLYYLFCMSVEALLLPRSEPSDSLQVWVFPCATHAQSIFEQEPHETAPSGWHQAGSQTQETERRSVEATVSRHRLRNTFFVYHVQVNVGAHEVCRAWQVKPSRDLLFFCPSSALLPLRPHCGGSLDCLHDGRKDSLSSSFRWSNNLTPADRRGILIAWAGACRLFTSRPHVIDSAP